MAILSNARHEAFAQARAKGMTIDAAYVAAGYKPNRSNAGRLNTNEHVKRRIRELQQASARQAVIDGADALEETARIAFSDLRDLFDGEGKLLPVEALPDNIAKAVKSVKVTTRTEPGSGDGGVVHTTEISFWDKNAALDRLFKHFNLYDTDDQKDPLAELARALMGRARPLPVATD